MPIGRVGRVTVIALFLSALASGCMLSLHGSAPIARTATMTVAVSVVDERGSPVADADVEITGDTHRTDDTGRVEIGLERPAVATVSRAGFLDEPVAIAPDDGVVTVRLWARAGPNGPRTSVHFGGDVMLGRRYLDADRPTPFVDDDASARRVVAELGPMAAAADATIVNLETVVGDLPPTAALPAKRYLLTSTPFITSALDELGVDAVTLGNNHAYDWGAAGLTSTLETLDAAGVDHVGASTDPAEAVRGRIIETSGGSLGIVSATTVTRDFLNDRLPSAEVLPPSGLAPDDAWQYERRPFGLRGATDGDELADLQVPLRGIRASEAWRIVETAERQLEPADADTVWRLTIAAFPELQDWVAEHGHGGVAGYRRDDVERDVRRLRSEGASFVVVQLHGGNQYSPFESEYTRDASRAAIDAGADAVVSHHPHVLQGVDRYRGGLIVYSLGNLVFDQDLLSTFPSAMLRLVVDEAGVVEARFLPLVIDRYRPTPLTGPSAREIVRTLNERSTLNASAHRLDGEQVVTVLDDPSDTTDEVTVRFDRNSGLVVPFDPSDLGIAPVGGNPEMMTLPPCTLVRTDAMPDGVEYGVELFGWGRFDRDTTDAHRTFPVGWLVPSEHERWDIVTGATGQPNDLAIELTSDPDTTTTVRIAGLIDLPRHRLYDQEGQPIDAPAAHQIRARVRRSRGEPPFVRLVAYTRHNADPMVAASTDRHTEVELPLDVPDDGTWHTVIIDVPDHLFDDVGDGGARALNVIVGTPPALYGTVAIDQFEVLEWRGATDASQPVWVAADRTRGGNGTVAVETRSC